MIQTDNRMGSGKILPLLLSMSVPPMLSMLVQALYNIVDSMFVARLSEEALTSVSLAFPLQNLILAVAVGFGVGLNACVARALGARDAKETKSAVAHGMLFTAVHSLLFIVIGLLLVKPFITLFTTDPQIAEMSCDYARIVLCFSFGSMFHLYAEKLFQAEGNMVLPMIFVGIGAVTNTILDPILIFGLLGFPALGVKGAAIATVIAQITAGVLSMMYIYKKGQLVKPSFKGFRFDLNVVKKIYMVGIPSAMMVSMPSILVGVLNSMLAAFSATAIGVFGLYIKIQTFVYMPASGVVQGLRPIMSYNYGAGNTGRMKQVLKASLMVSAVIMAVGTVFFLLFPELIMKLFDAKEDMMAIGVPMLRTISTGFLISAVGVVISGAFEALGKGISSLVITLLRQLVIVLAVSAVLTKVFGIYGIWISFPVAECVAAVAAIMMYRRFMKKR